MLDGNGKKIVIGDKIEYVGDERDDADLYEDMEENGWVHEVEAIDEDGMLLWVVGCSYAIQANLVTLWEYD